MNKFTFNNFPTLRMLDDNAIEEIHESALDILENCGIYFNCEEALSILKDAGCIVNFDTQIARIPRDLVIKCVETTPDSVKLYDRDGNFYRELKGNASNFYPGSCPKNMLDRDGITVRPALAEDMRNIAKIAEYTPQYNFVSASVVCNEAPFEIGDTYIYYNVMNNSTKPIMGGGVDVPGTYRTFEMIKALRESEKDTREKPYTIFDICPAPPLKWSEISSHNIIDCANLDIPICLISVPMAGVGSPVSIAGSILQHTAETLSGIVLAQVIKPGLPMVYGGAPCTFDMRTTYTPMSALESTMITTGYSLMGKYYGMPTHTYAALSDSKVVDYQAGSETMRSALGVTMAGVNNIAGAGGLNVIAEQCLEKLVIDAQEIAMVQRFARGICVDTETLALDLIKKVGPGGDFLGEEHTFRLFREEHCIVNDIVQKQERSHWERDGKRTILQRAGEEVDRILALPDKHLDQKHLKAVKQVFSDICKDAGHEEFGKKVAALDDF